MILEWSVSLVRLSNYIHLKFTNSILYLSTFLDANLVLIKIPPKGKSYIRVGSIVVVSGYCSLKFSFGTRKVISSIFVVTLMLRYLVSIKYLCLQFESERKRGI